MPKTLLEAIFQITGILVVSFLFSAGIRFFDLSSTQIIAVFLMFWSCILIFTHIQREKPYNVSPATLKELRIVLCDEPITYKVAIRLSLELYHFNRLGSDPIKILINSPGGEARWLGFILCAIRASQSPVIGIVVGNAYSAAMILLQSCRQRFAFPEATFLYHPPAASYVIGRTSISVEQIEYDIQSLSQCLSFGKRKKEDYEKIVMQRSGLSLENLRAIENREITASYAQTLNFIDGIITKI